MTLDGVDNNDQTKGYALQGGLRATLDSIEEFRVTTTNSGAEQGRSSGAQVSVITKSGTNQFHGSAYEYNRPKGLVANDWFNKHSELQNGEPNTPASLLRNTFGGSVGGPIKKDRLYFFAAYEGQRTHEATQTTRVVPSSTLREGILLYQCDDPSQCPGGSQQVQGIDTSQIMSLTPKTYTVNVPQGYYALSSPNIASMDPNCSANGVCPWGAGVNPYTLTTMNQYPQANTNQVGDGFNYLGYTFSAATPNKLDTYVVKFDANLTQSGTQRLFVRLGLQNDHGSKAPQFPGDVPSEVDTNNSKGIIVGYTWTISADKVNNFRYGFIRQGVGTDGAGDTSIVYLRGLDPIQTDLRSSNYVVPVHNFADDYSWTHGKHTIQFGGNWRFINDQINSNNNSFSDATTNVGWLPSSAVANTGGTLDPGAQANGCLSSDCPWVFPTVSGAFGSGYDFPVMALVGPVSEVDAAYQRTKDGTLLPDGATIGRHFRVNELDFYAQDSWRMKPNLTLTWGLRYSLLQAPYEVNGNQVAPSIDLGQFFQQRMAAMQQGLTYSPTISVDLSGPANGKPGYWKWDPKDFAPRFALAWSPGATSGIWGSLFGGPGKSSIRFGAGMYYDHFGLATVNTFDRNGSYGLTTLSTSQFGAVGVDDAPRYTSGNLDDPSYATSLSGLTPPPPVGGFPQTPPLDTEPGGFTPYWGLDSNMKTPYSYDFDVSFSRELKGGFVVEAAYVGRLGRRLLQERDLAQPLNITDPASKTTYYQAAAALTKLAEQNGGQGMDLSQVQQIPYWQNIFPGANGTTISSLQDFLGCSGPPNSQGLSTLNATQAIYYVSACNLHNETTTLQYLDLYCFPACPFINGQQTQGTQYYLSQFPSLYAWQSIGRSNYNAGQFSIRHKSSHGLEWDFNYVYSKSIDEGSNAERVSSYEGEIGLASLIYNAFQPGQNRAVSDYDATHQINSNWVYELPYGQGQKWGGGSNRFLQAVFGNWSISGLYRWSSGFPFSVGNGFRFPTDWEWEGNAVQVGPAKTGLYTDSNGNPNAFAAASTGDGVACLLPQGPQGCTQSFRFAYAGESGNRNNFRGQGIFDIDLAIRKTWNLTERQALSFTYDVYNVTNSVRFGFDATQNFPAIDTAGSFGNYNQTLMPARVMEFALRYSF